MNEEVEGLLNKAEESLQAARLLHQEGYNEFAISRAYYTMFYLAEAMLASIGLSFSSHAAVNAAFGREFAKPNIVDRKFHRYLLDAEDMRHMGDYAVGATLTAAHASETLTWATEFLAMTRYYFSQSTGGSDVSED
jgi:uncharacterized protein (UPF0332 family)